MSCQHDCDKPAAFPRLISNRPALDNIRYRIGDYHSFREYLLDQLDKTRKIDICLRAFKHKRKHTS